MRTRTSFPEAVASNKVRTSNGIVRLHSGAPMTDLDAIFKLGIIPTFTSRGDRDGAINLAEPNAECEYALFTVAPREAHSSSPPCSIQTASFAERVLALGNCGFSESKKVRF